MRLGRRVFLQRTGLALAAFGVSEASFLSWADQYHQALAQPTRRKLALLVGIDQYPDQVCDFTPGQGVALQGCVTDVALQQELLIHRFGFQPADILTLTNQQATRQAITEAFQSHLAEQARFGDVVVFHFSGYGSQIRLDSQPEALRNSLVPVDGFLPTENNPIINDLFEDTLGLLLKLLKTQQVTTVLDLGHADLGKILWGNLRVRSRPNIPTGQLGPRELALQTTLRTRTKTIQTGAGKTAVQPARDCHSSGDSGGNCGGRPVAWIQCWGVDLCTDSAALACNPCNDATHCFGANVRNHSAMGWP